MMREVLIKSAEGGGWVETYACLDRVLWAESFPFQVINQVFGWVLIAATVIDPHIGAT